jgi:hypothetical protein
MNSRSAIPLSVLALFLFFTSSLVAQSGFAVIDVSQQFTDDGLVITYKFNKSVASLAQSQLSYRKVTSTGSTERQIPFVTPAPNNMTFSFKVPQSEFDGSDRIEFQAKLINGAGATVFTSQQSSFDLGFYKNSADQIRKANDKAATLDTQVTDLKSQLASSNSKLDAAQKSLNTVTKGFEPERVNYVRDFPTDRRIVVVFNTGGIPGRIKATIEGPNGFNKPVPSENISTDHVIVFDGLTPSTSYQIKAVALKLEDKSEITPSAINAISEPRLKITTKPDIAPPVASFTVSPSFDRLKVSVTSDQDAFAEISYVPLDANSAPIMSERNQVGSIRQDEFFSYTGDKRVAGGIKATDFTLADLKENTQYTVTVRLVNQIGKTPSQALVANPRTSVKPTPFEFAKAVNVELSPLGVKVVWRSTTNAKEAKLQVVYEGDATVTIDKPATISGNEITGNIDVASVVQMIKKDKVPILRLIMSDGSGPMLQRDLQVSFVMPKNAEIKANTALTDPAVKNTLLDVTNKIESGKGVDWKKLLGSGLSMVVKAFLPIP